MSWYATKPNQTLEILGKLKKYFTCIIHIDIFKFVAVKFKLNLAFVQTCIWFLSTKNKNFI